MKSLKRVGVIAVAGLALAAPGLAHAGTAKQIEADVFEGNQVIAQLEGSITARGTGELQIYPAGTRYRKGELTKVEPSGSGYLVSGARGTRFYLSVIGNQVSGSGNLVLTANTSGGKPRATTWTHVRVGGASLAHRYHPQKGDTILVLGKPSGDVYDALKKVYKMTRLSLAKHGRTQYIQNPAAFAHVAGVLVGRGVTVSPFLVRAVLQPFYLSGRWVAASPRSKAFDKAVFQFHHYSSGNKATGAITRLRGSGGGTAGRNRVHISAPVIAMLPITYVGKHKRRVPQALFAPQGYTKTLPPRIRAGVRKQVIAQLVKAINAGAGDRPRVHKRRLQAALDDATTENSAYYELDVNQLLDIVIQWWTMGPYANSCPPYGGGCDTPTVQNQTVSVTYDTSYLVMLTTSGGEATPRQEIAEVSHITANAYDFSTGSKLASGTVANDNSVSLQNKEVAWLIGGVYHRIHLGCSGCVQIGTQTAAKPVFLAHDSQPQTQITSATAGSSSGSGTSTSNSVSSSWSVGGNFGFFGGDPTGGVNGSYGQSKSTTVSQSYSLSQSVDYAIQNWTLVPKMNAGADASFLMYSSGIANSPGIDFGSGNGTGWIADGIDGDTGPGPVVTPTTGSTGGHNGYGMNVTGLNVPSISSFIFNPLAVGTVTPQTVDNIFLADIFNDDQVPGTQWGELQVSGEQTVTGAIDPGNTAWNTSGYGTSSGTSNGLAGASQAIYFNSAGKEVGSGSAYAAGSQYSFNGLDLCAPPVDYLTLWNGGCYTQYKDGKPITN